MKSTLFGLLIVSALAVPTVSFAQQTNGPVTRAEVKAQLAQLEKAGFDPGAQDDDYPQDIQAAEARVQAQQLAAQGTVSDVGSSAGGSSQAGAGSAATPYVGSPSVDSGN
jgi:hypothetical protein